MSIFFQEERATQLKNHYKELCSKPNSKMIGRTLDANHLEKFLRTGYGESTVYYAPTPKPNLLTDKQKLHSLHSGFAIQSNVRPDPCFLNVPRSLRKDALHGSSSKPFELVYSKFSVPTSKEAIDRTYKRELREVGKLKEKYDPARLLLNQEDVVVKSPKERKKEMEEIKCNMQNYAEFKRAKELAERRRKQVKAGWRNGVVGIDCVMNPETFFFKERQHDMAEREHERYEINNANYNCTSLSYPTRSNEIQEK